VPPHPDRFREPTSPQWGEVKVTTRDITGTRSQ
jgi:hypothetical protein